MSSELDGRKLTDMRVVDLRAELEKRGLDKTGNKQILLERLQKVLDEESVDGGNQKAKMELKTTDATSNGENKPVEQAVIGEKGDEKSEEQTDASKAENEDDLDDENTKDEEDEAKAEEDTKNDKTEDADSKNATNPDESSTEIKEDVSAPEEVPEDMSEANADQDDEMDEKSNKDTAEENPTEEDKSITEGTLDDNSDEQSTRDNNQQTDSAESSLEKSDKGKETSEDSKKKEDTKDQDNKTVSSEKSQAGKAPAASKASMKERFLNEQNRNLWITNISQNTRATELKQALSEHGKVIGAKVVINARHPAACCYGYVKMETAADADNCIAKLNNTELNGHIIRIEKVRPDHLSPLKHKLETSQREKLHLRQNTTSQSTTPKKDEPKEDKEKEPVKEKEGAQKENKDEKKTEKPAEKKDAKDDKKNDSKRHVYRSRSRDRKSREKPRSTSRGRTERSLSAKSANRVGKERERELLTFDKIKDERERERLRERERILRDRRREEAARQREIERHQRSEAVRLEREREKLRRERERLEREKAEFMQFERERQKLEREKLELERIELERAKMRMQEEERRTVKRPAPASNYRERERSYEDRKRIPTDRHFDEAPPPPRFDPPPSLKGRDTSPPIKKFSSSNTSSSKDYKSRVNYDKREAFPQKRDYDDRSHPPSISRNAAPVTNKYESGSSSYSSNRDRGDMRDPRVRESGNLSSVSNTKYTPSDSSKVSRYNERDRSPHFRSVRDDRDRRPVTEGKSDIRPPRSDHRYPEQQKESVRYERTSSSSSWSPQKVFSAASTPANKQWTKDSWRTDAPSTTERWNATNPQRGTTGISSSAFSNNTGINMGPSCPPPPGINNYVNDRFDYKANMGNIRKY